MKSTFSTLGLIFGAATLLPACANRQLEQHAHYAPGLGHIMAQSAMRHAKLWFAGQAENWDLAAYEVDELHEGFEDAGKYHPTHKHITRPIPELIAGHMDQPLEELERAIKDKNLQAFTASYDKLTVACNACHQTTAFAFNIVTRPSFNPFANQAFGTSQ